MTHEEVWDHVSVYLEVHGVRIGRRARQDCVYRMRHWLKVAPQIEWRTEAIEAYRSAALLMGYSAAYIESVVATVRFIAAHFACPIPMGKALCIPRPDPDVPTTERVGRLYRSASVAQWPHRLQRARRTAWWRSFIVVACWTGLRLGDLRRLTWDSISADSITWKAAKTKRHGRASLCVPMVPPVRRHLEILRSMNMSTVLGLTDCHRQLRRELKRIAMEGGVASVLPQGLRRYAINQWAKADQMAGQIIQGKSLGVMNHYLGVKEFLISVAPNVQMPADFLSPRERLAIAGAEKDLIRSFRRANPADKALIETILRRLG